MTGPPAWGRRAWASNLACRLKQAAGHVSHGTRSTRMSFQRLRSPMLTFAAKKLLTDANGPMKDAASFLQLCPRSFDRAVMGRCGSEPDSEAEGTAPPLQHRPNLMQVIYAQAPPLRCFKLRVR